MPTFGAYETLSEEPIAERRHTGHVTTVWRARRTGTSDGREYAIKLYTPVRQPPRETAAEEELDDDPCQSFLEGVKRLGKAQQEGGRCLARVVDLGRTDGGAWFATDFRPRGSLEDFIDRKLSLGSAGLRHVVSSLVTGCLALKLSSGRSHGGLKSANVLLASEGPALPRTALELIDPYPASLTAINRLGPRDRQEVTELLEQAIELQDLRCIGELILQLVEQRQVRNAYDYNYPIQISPAWTGLGKDGEWWLELCNRLLDPHLAAGTISLESLANEIRPGGTLLNLPKMAIAAAALVLVLGVVSGGVMVVKKMKSGAELKKLEAYQSATNAAEIALAATDHAEAIRQAEIALEVRPDDPSAADLLRQARTAQQELAARERLERYQSATNAAQDALVRQNYSEVIRQADLALAIQPNDPVATRFKQDGQRAQSALTQADRDYQSATNAAAAALREMDYAEALRQADLALGIRPDDAVANQLKSVAQRGQVEMAAARQAFQSATNAASMALAETNYSEAIRQADIALGIKPNDPAATRLKLTAQRERQALAQAERDYQSATNAAATALNERNFAEAIRQANLALGIRPNDPTASGLRQEAQRGQATLAQSEKDYQTATNAADVALRERDFTEAIRQADAALRLKPNDAVATRLKEGAQEGQTLAQGAERNYRTATNSAGIALRDQNIDEAVRQADIALGIKPDDPAAVRLKSAAQQARADLAQAERDFQSATNGATTALAERNYSEALKQADIALGIKPNDAASLNLKREAQNGLDVLAQAERDYRAATNSAGIAIRQRDFGEAIRQADAALALRPNDSTASKLKSGAQAEQAAMLEAEKIYQTATNAAGVALVAGNYDEVIRQADLALKIKPNDPHSTQLKRQAQSQVAYQTAMTRGKAALQAKDYPAAIALADEALQIRDSDAAASQLKADAQGAQSAVDSDAAYTQNLAFAQSAYDAGKWSEAMTQADLALAQKPNDPEALRIKQTANERLAAVRTLDTQLQMYQVMFRLAEPRNDLRYQTGQRVEQLPNRQIDQSFLDDVQKRLTALENAFDQAGGLSTERQDALKSLTSVIKGWNNRY